MEAPLLSEKKRESEKWDSYQYLQRTGSSIRAASIAGNGVTIEEIRSASAVSDPSPLYPPVVNTPVSIPTAQTIGYPSAYGGSHEFQRQTLDEIEIRELLNDHVGHHCCWGRRPALTWKIEAVEDCNVYVGTLDTFVEEREIVKQTLPSINGNVLGKKKKGDEPGLWEIDLKSEFPSLFVPFKETLVPIPNSETIVKCSDCAGRGDIVCPTCNVEEEAGFYKENQMTGCSSCHGRGLIAHRDGSDTICMNCKGKGKIPCPTCRSRGLIKCETCNGNGSLITTSTAVVKWKTLSTRKISATRGAGSVPEEVFERAEGIQLCNTQAYQCTPAYFADSYFLNKFSSAVISTRLPVPQSANIICEKHTISVVPVTRVTMSDNGKASFNFYIIGFGKDVYLKDYYPTRACWGLCSCLEWFGALR